jgi:2-polyprenyl-3-methyl-5-hydroxy-6-metoxy-1,4-benzoquinol methylase
MDDAYLNNTTPWEKDAPQVLNWLPDLKQGSVLDLGCGTGVYSEFLHKRGLKVTGLDSSEVAIKKARTRVPEANFELFDLNHLEKYTGGKFDLILDVKTLAFLDDEQKYLRVVRSLLKPNGWFILQIFTKHVRSELVAKSVSFPFSIKDSRHTVIGETEMTTYFFQL